MKNKAYEYGLKYIEMGFHPLPLDFRSKKCTLKGWSNLEITNQNFEKYFSENNRQNVSLLLGEKHGGLIDVDIDDPEALDFAEKFLPKTGMVFGRKSKPKSHFMYISPKITKTTQFSE